MEFDDIEIIDLETMEIPWEEEDTPDEVTDAAIDASDSVRRKRRLAFLVAEIVLALAIGVLVGILFLQRSREAAQEALYDRLQTMKTVEEPVTDGEAAVIDADAGNTFTVSGTDADSILQPDFATLQEMNPDIYAWISIADTVVDYPVVQRAGDDSYYLNHNIDGSSGYPGCIYTESSVNSRSFDDAVTVLYGHNMRNGTMFRVLHDYSDVAFFETHRTIVIQTETEEMEYLVLAAGSHNDDYLFTAYDLASDAGVQTLLTDIIAGGNSVSDAEAIAALEEGEHYIVLSTCNRWNSSKRYLVVAKRL